MNWDWQPIPDVISYDALLNELRRRPNVRSSDDEQAYLFELIYDLMLLDKRVKTQAVNSYWVNNTSYDTE
ncbi:MAG TPA: hypothetical protein V6D17_12800 [Candidatus Obscuribacterales bacterium]